MGLWKRGWVGSWSGDWALTVVLAGPITERLRDEGVTPEDASRCSALLVTQLVGVIYARYVLAADPVATTPKQAFIDGLIPALNAVLNQCVGRRRDPAD